MAIKTISQFPSGIPADNDYILFEQNGEGKSAKFSDFSLSYEEIMATTDLSGKVASASALKVASQTIGVPDYSKAVLIDNTLTSVNFNYTAPSNGIIVVSGYGTSQQTSYIVLVNRSVTIRQQGTADESISAVMQVAKGDVVNIKTHLSYKNDGTYFIPYK